MTDTATAVQWCTVLSSYGPCTRAGTYRVNTGTGATHVVCYRHAGEMLTRAGAASVTATPIDR